MERDLLSRVTGNTVRQQQRLQGQDPRPPPSPALSLHLGSQQAPQSQAEATIRGHALAPQQPHHHAQSPAAASSPFASDRLASVVVPGYPMSQRRHNLRAGARAQPGPTRAPPAGPTPTAAQVPTTLQLAGPTAAPGEERCCDACGLSAELLRGLTSDLDRARAQVALLTCQNESLRSRLKRAAAAAAPELTIGPPASSAHVSLRCGSCRVRPATVVLVPREHLCLCGRCCSDAAVACSVCRAAAEGTGHAVAAAPRRRRRPPRGQFSQAGVEVLSHRPCSRQEC